METLAITPEEMLSIVQWASRCFIVLLFCLGFIAGAAR